MASSAAYLATVLSAPACCWIDSTISASFDAGIAHVISVGDMPVRTRLSAHPTLAAGTPSSLAIATMWHWGLPSMRKPGMASDSTII